MRPITRMYGDTIKVTQLYYVRAAADLGSFTRAAAALGVTQPALSNGIAALEHTLGGQLFDRSTTGVVLTPLARRVLPHLNGLLSSLDAMLTEARTAADQTADPVRMGVSPLIDPGLVARIFQAARQQAPATLILKEDNLADLYTALLARQLDLILVPAVTDAPGCQRRRVDTEPVHFLASTQPAGADKGDESTLSGDPIELVELSGQPLVMVGEACGLTTFTRTLFAANGAELLPYLGEADSYRSLEAWAHLGLGGALMPISRFREGQQTRPVHHQGTPVTIEYEALWPSHSARTAAIQALLDAVLGKDM